MEGTDPNLNSALPSPRYSALSRFLGFVVGVCVCVKFSNPLNFLKCDMGVVIVLIVTTANIYCLFTVSSAVFCLCCFF